MSTTHGLAVVHQFGEADRRQQTTQEAGSALPTRYRRSSLGGVGIVFADCKAGADDEANTPKKRQRARGGVRRGFRAFWIADYLWRETDAGVGDHGLDYQPTKCQR